MMGNTVDIPVTAQGIANSLIKRFDLFHFISWSAGLADIKVFG
jgi:hypothetical protein